MPRSNLYLASDVQALPTIHSAHCCDLKIERPMLRVWLCRVGRGVTVETFEQDDWIITSGSCTSTSAAG
jgi:hypothetical protein